MDRRGMYHTVLFLGSGNAARSIVAEAILNREGGGKFRAFSAGAAPARELDPHARNLLTRLRFDMADTHPKEWSELAGDNAPAFDVVITLSELAALLPRSAWRGHPLFAHWDIDDPARTEGSVAEIELAYADTFRMLSNRIGIFVNLPLRAIDRMTMQRELARIGGAGAAPKAGAVA